MTLRRTIAPVCVALGLSALAAASVAAQPANLDDVVVFAKSYARLSTGGRQASGYVVVDDPGGLVQVHPNYKTIPDVMPSITADTLEVFFYFLPGPILFDVFTNQVIDVRGTMSVLGTLTVPIGMTLPLFPFPAAPTVTPGTTSVLVTRATSPVTLPPGDYDTLRIFAGGVVFLEGGTYNFRNIRVGGRGQLLANAATTINVLDKLRLRGRSNFGPADPILSGRCIELNAATSRRISFGRLADATAVFTAPNARLRLGRLGTYRGRFTAQQVVVGRGTVIATLPPLTEPCS